MRFEYYDHWQQLPEQVDTLFDQTSRSSMFFSRPWFETLYTTAFDKSQTLLLACVVREGEVLALLPLVQRDDDNWGAFRHRYTALYTLLLADQEQAGILDCLVAGLRQLSITSLLLEPVHDDDGNMHLLRQAMTADGFDCQQHFRFYNWIHRTQGQSFEQYMADRPARLRNTIARKQRKLQREHDVDIRLFRGEEVASALHDYHAAYSASWKAFEQYGDLLDGLAVNLAAPDWTRLAVLYIDGEAAAAQLWFVVHGKASIFRLAYHEQWKAYSTGSILTAWLMRYVIDSDHVEEIDFLTGNENYKQDWMSERRQCCSLVFYRQREPKRGADSMMSKLKGLFSSKQS